MMNIPERYFPSDEQPWSIKDIYTLPLPMDFPDTIAELGWPEAVLEKCIKREIPIYVFVENVMRNTRWIATKILEEGIVEYYKEPSEEVIEKVKQRILEIYPTEVYRQIEFKF